MRSFGFFSRHRQSKRASAGSNLSLSACVASIGSSFKIALETSLVGTFEFVLRKDLHLKAPRGETQTHFIAMGLNPDLTEALKMAVRPSVVATEPANKPRLAA